MSERVNHELKLREASFIVIQTQSRREDRLARAAGAILLGEGLMEHTWVRSYWPAAFLLLIVISHLAIKYVQVAEERVGILRFHAENSAQSTQLSPADRLEEAKRDVRQVPVEKRRPGRFVDVDQLPSYPGAIQVRHLSPARLLLRTAERKLDDPSLYMILACGVAAFLISRGFRVGCGCVLAPPPWIRMTTVAVFVVSLIAYLFVIHSKGEAFFFTDSSNYRFDLNKMIVRAQWLEGITVILAIAVIASLFGPALWLALHVRSEIKDSDQQRHKLKTTASCLASCVAGPFLLAALYCQQLLFWVVPFLSPSTVLEQAHWSGRAPAIALYTMPFLVISLVSIAALWKGYRFRLRTCKPFETWLKKMTDRHVGDASGVIAIGMGIVTALIAILGLNVWLSVLGLILLLILLLPHLRLIDAIPRPCEQQVSSATD